MRERRRLKRVLIAPDMVIMLLFAGGRWRQDAIPLDAKVVDAYHDDYLDAFVLVLESPSFPLVSPDDPPILDVMLYKDFPDRATGAK